MKNIIIKNLTTKEHIEAIKLLMTPDGKKLLKISEYAHKRYLIPINTDNEYFLEVGLYSEDENMIEIINNQIYLTFGKINSAGIFAPLRFPYYESAVPVPAILDYIDLRMAELIIDQFKSFPDYGNNEYINNLYHKVWSSWNTILEINKEVQNNK